MATDMEMMMDEVVKETSQEMKANVAVQKTCTETLKKLGYEVIENGSDIVLKKGERKYTLRVFSTPMSSDSFIRIPVDCIDGTEEHLFNTNAQCVAFYQAGYEGGTLIQFPVNTLRDLIKDVVANLRKEAQYTFYEKNAIGKKKLFASYDYDSKRYDLFIYVPIELVCSRLKSSKQKIGSVK